jgi:hypothetical protein
MDEWFVSNTYIFSFVRRAGNLADVTDGGKLDLVSTTGFDAGAVDVVPETGTGTFGCDRPRSSQRRGN